MKLKTTTGKEVKLPKDKIVNARVNSKIYDLIKQKGESIQKILDRYIKRNYVIDESGEVRRRGDKWQ